MIRPLPEDGIGAPCRRAITVSVYSQWRRLALAFAADAPARSVALAALDDGAQTVSVAGDLARPGASLLKLPLVASVFAAAAEGRFALNDRVAVRQLQPTKWSCVSDSLARDSVLTIEDLCSLAITVSDNPCADFLCHLVEVDWVNRWLEMTGCSADSVLRVGFSDEDIEQKGRENRITANDCVTILRAIFSRDLYAPLRLAMYNNIRNQRIPRLLGDEVLVAHKTGSLAGVVNDAGVLHTVEGPLISVFLCDAETDPLLAEDAIGRAALACVQALEGSRGSG